MINLNPPEGITTTNQMIDIKLLANCRYATRAPFHESLHGSPESLTCGQDSQLQKISHDYRVGDEISKLAYSPGKLSSRAYDGPYTIETVHANGTITIRLNPHVI